MTRNRLTSLSKHQRGLTLVELLVALGLGLLVTVIAATALLIGQQGYQSIDSTTQLRDRERFATDLITRVIVQAGYQDLGAASISLRSSATALGLDPEPDVYGWNDAVYSTPDDLVLSTSTKITNADRPGKCAVSDTSCVNGSDILVLRFQGVSSPSNAAVSDNTMINCMGQGETGLTSGALDDRAVSVFHVTRGTNGEPSLSCSYYNFATGIWVASAPMIEGVESLQFLFGTDQVVPLTAPSAVAIQDTIADRWLRADQLTVAGDLAATRENWRRVRAVREGMVIRGPVGSVQQATAATIAPLGSTYASTSDNLIAAPDRRLRLQSTFTVHLRNDLTLR